MMTSNRAPMLNPREIKRAARCVFWKRRARDCREARRRSRRAERIAIANGDVEVRVPGIRAWDVY